MNSQKVQIVNREDVKIAAQIDFPLKEPVAFALFAHCFTCNKNLPAVNNISRALCAEGIAVLRFDFTGLGNSEGDFSDSNFSTNLTDIEDAADWLNQHYQAPALLIGHSLGGAAVLRAAQNLDKVQGVVTIGAPFSPAHVTHLFDQKLEEINDEGEAEVSIGGRPFRVRKQLLNDLQDNATEDLRLDKATLIFHSPQDQIVDIENAANIYKALHHPKSFVSLDGADHLVSNRKDSLYIGRVIASWSTRYIGEIESESGLTTNREVVSSTSSDALTTDILAGNHPLTADEPEKVSGGKDKGPDPYALMMSALGACTGMTLQMYAKKKQIDLKEVRVHLSIDKDYQKDCEDSEEKDDRLGKIFRELELVGDLDHKTKERLLEIANKCPVHKTLSRGVHVDTSYSKQ